MEHSEDAESKPRLQVKDRSDLSWALHILKDDSWTAAQSDSEEANGQIPPTDTEEQQNEDMKTLPENL
jgi:hypothetical protein